MGGFQIEAERGNRLHCKPQPSPADGYTLADLPPEKGGTSDILHLVRGVQRSGKKQKQAGGRGGPATELYVAGPRSASRVLPEYRRTAKCPRECDPQDCAPALTYGAALPAPLSGIGVVDGPGETTKTKKRPPSSCRCTKVVTQLRRAFGFPFWKELKNYQA